MNTNARTILLDIEGTTSSISFVHDVMFPFVRREVAAFLSDNWDNAAVAEACNQIAIDAGHESLDGWAGDQATDKAQQELIRNEVTRLMDGDVKATGLKALQGLIWKSGFHSREMVAHVYDDVVPAINEWKSAGIDLRIYSSGSVGAQKLFFGHTEHGDLLDNFSAHYDTTIGSKRESSSYVRIASDIGQPANTILFASDVLAELEAAKSAGMQTVLSIRLGNAPVEGSHDHPSITSFGDINLTI